MRGKGWADVHMTTSEPEWMFEIPNKAGGIFCISNNRMRSQVIKRIKDTADRWAGTIFLFKSGVKVAMISLYQVGKRAQSGVKMVYSQQNAWIRKTGRTAKKWAKQNRAQLTTKRLKKVYSKLSYFTGKKLTKGCNVSNSL